MATYRTAEESWAVGIESTAGNPAALGLETHSVLVTDESEMTFEESVLDRSGYPQATVQELPTRPQQMSGSAVLVVPFAGQDTTLDSGTSDPDYDGRGTDAMLRACGHYVSNSPAGLREYSLRSTGTFETCTIERTNGPLWQQMAGCAGTYSIEGEAGGVPMLRFEMKGTYDPPVTGAISGSDADLEAIAPPHYRGYATLGTLTNLLIRSVRFNAGVSVAPRLIFGPRQVAVFKAFREDASGGPSFVDETTDANSATADDVQPFPATPAVGDAFTIGARVRPSGVKVQITTQVAADYTVVLKYWNGSAWTALSTGINEVVFSAAAGVYQATFKIPSDMTQVALNSSTAYWMRFEVTAIGGAPASSANIGQVWVLLPGYGVHSYVPAVKRQARLSIVAELEALTTWDPWQEFHFPATDVADTAVTVPFGSAANNTLQLSSTTGFYAATPTFEKQDGIWVVNATLGLQSWLLKIGTIS